MSVKGAVLPKKVTKFLVFSDDAKYLSYVFGKQGFYVENVRNIAPKDSQAVFQRPSIITTRYDDVKQIALLLNQADSRLNIRRIFKNMRAKDPEKIDGFIKHCVRNLIHLASGHTIRVSCKDNQKLQQRFYNAFVKFNEEDKTNCKFDFDEYDVAFIIKEYIDKDGAHWFITSLEAKNEEVVDELREKLEKPVAREIDTGFGNYM